MKPKVSQHEPFLGVTVSLRSLGLDKWPVDWPHCPQRKRSCSQQERWKSTWREAESERASWVTMGPSSRPWSLCLPESSVRFLSSATTRSLIHSAWCSRLSNFRWGECYSWYKKMVLLHFHVFSLSTQSWASAAKTHSSPCNSNPNDLFSKFSFICFEEMQLYFLSPQYFILMVQKFTLNLSNVSCLQ